MSSRRHFACVLIWLGLSACGGSGEDAPTRLAPSMTITLEHSDLVFDATRQRLYAVSSDLRTPARIVSVDVASGQVRELVSPTDPPRHSPVTPQPGTLSLSAQGRYLWFVTQSGSASRVDLASGAVDLTLSAPLSMDAKVAAVAGSEVEDATAYVQLRSNAGDADAVGVLRNGQWGTQWARVPWISADSRTLAVRGDDAELLSQAYDLNRVRVGAAGPEAVLAIAPGPFGATVPRYVVGGALAGTSIYDATSLALLFRIPDAEVCDVLPSRSRVVCASAATLQGHSLYVVDLPSRRSTAGSLAGFAADDVLSISYPRRITSLDGGRIAVSYGSCGGKICLLDSGWLAIYSHAAFH